MWNTTQYLNIDGYGDIAFRETGNVVSDTQAPKPVMVFLHGLGLNSFFWTPTMEYLRNDFRCIAIDLPGHGNSKKVRGDFSMTYFSVMIRKFIEQMNLHEITLVGHSMGGQIGIITALQIPSVITKLVLVCSAGAERFTEEEAKKFMIGAEHLYRTPLELVVLTQLYAAQLSKRAEHLSELMEEHLQQQKEKFGDFSELVLACMRGMLKEPVHAFLTDISQPTLLVYGEKDALIPNRILHPDSNTGKIARDAAALIPNSHLELFGACGHYLPFEEPHLLSKKMQEFYLQ